MRDTSEYAPSLFSVSLYLFPASERHVEAVIFPDCLQYDYVTTQIAAEGPPNAKQGLEE